MGLAEEQEGVDKLQPRDFRLHREEIFLVLPFRHWYALSKGPWNFLFTGTLRTGQPIIYQDGLSCSSLKAKFIMNHSFDLLIPVV